MKSRRFRFALFLVVLTTCSGWILAWPQTQEPQPAQPVAEGSTPTIKAETRLVLVDTVVTDKKGNYIRDLTAERLSGLGGQQGTDGQNFFRRDGCLRTFRRTAALLDPVLRQLHHEHDRPGAGAGGGLEISGWQYRRQSLYRDREFRRHPPGRAELHHRRRATEAGSAQHQFSRPRRPMPGPRARSRCKRCRRVSRKWGMPQTNFGVRTLLLALRNMAKGLASVPGRKTLVLLSCRLPAESRRSESARTRCRN